VLDRTLIWNLRHLMMVLREYEDFYNSHRPHRALDQAAPLRPLPDGITDLDHFGVRRYDRRGRRHPRISPGGIRFRHLQAGRRAPGPAWSQASGIRGSRQTGFAVTAGHNQVFEQSTTSARV
jgi:hypothetical protein